VQTAEIMKALEPILESEQPDWVLLYGDTNSTLAGAMVAAKLGLRIAHVEAGLRSYNRRMPEEINRIVTDHLSELLLCPTAQAMVNLGSEGLGDRAELTGDAMYDAVLAFKELAERRADRTMERWRPGEFALATIHRAENTDDPQRLRSILTGLETVARTLCPVVLPLHPRTAKYLAAMGWSPEAVAILPPVSYLDMILLESRACFILTDSGGVQKEAYFAKVPCVTLRDETEWVETLENNCNVLTGADPDCIVAAAANAHLAGPWTAVYGEGNAAQAVLESLLSYAGSRPRKQYAGTGK
jgi:UDP-GlcNAc3NAcA epimerase